MRGVILSLRLFALVPDAYNKKKNKKRSPQTFISDLGVVTNRCFSLTSGLNEGCSQAVYTKGPTTEYICGAGQCSCGQM